MTPSSAEGFHNRVISNTPVHCIYRVRGSVPRAKILGLKSEMDEVLAALRQRYPDYEEIGSHAERAYLLEKEQFDEQYEARYEGLLHQYANREMPLQAPAVKQVILDSWYNIAARGLIDLYAVSVMSNHVHVLCGNPHLTGVVNLVELMASHQRFTTTQLNRLEDRKGRKLWVRRFFDRDVRPGRFEQVLWYILNNPVKAGLSSDPLNWIGNYVKPGLV